MQGGDGSAALFVGPEALQGLVDGELDEGEGDLRVFVFVRGQVKRSRSTRTHLANIYLVVSHRPGMAAT